MIVTFHLAAYFVYYIWNTYISYRITDSESTPTNNSSYHSNNNDRTNPTDGNGSGNIGSGNVEARELLEDGVIKSKSDQEDISKSLSDNKDQDNQPQNRPSSMCLEEMEGKGDFHPCLPQVLSNDEDRGLELIYNVEPEYGCICSDEKIQFFPPVYTQRYMEIERVLKEPRWAETVKKVVDFGCAELSFEMKYLKKLFGIEEIVAVDIDTYLLEDHCCKVGPFPTDYLKKRPTPLSIRVFCGSVAHTHESLVGADAVIAIELIEHLFPPELDCLPFTVFGFVKPKIAIFTTPNADFNVLFKNMSGFRHPDHKFEWTQRQFEDWGHNLTQRYPDYQVKFKGIGPGPKGTEELGCCSQMATFIRINESLSTSDDEINVQHGSYSLIRETTFPFFKDERTEEEKAIDDAECFITNCKMRSRVYDEVKAEIPLTSVMERIQYHDKEKLKEMLKTKNWEIKMNTDGEEVVVFPEEEEEDTGSEGNEYVIESYENCDYYETADENWDLQENADMDLTLTEGLCCNHNISSGSDNVDDHACVADKSYQNVDIVNTKDKCVCITKTENPVVRDVKICNIENCSSLETTVPDIELSERFNSSQVESDTKKDTNLNFETSIYETPNVKGCKKALFLDSYSPKGFAQFEMDLQSEDTFCLSTVPSSCDTSIYATPFCSRHNSKLPKCLSLQQISSHYGSPDLMLKEGKLDKEQKDKFSKSVEGFKSLESDLTSSSLSRVVDSGYPDSYSDYNMEMDLTPEQFDDIETESDENDVSSRSLTPPPPPQIPWLVDDVQNGDVANNNRDGEGNNMVADMEEEAIDFEARIDEFNNEVLNLAEADNDEINFCSAVKQNDSFQEICGDCLPSVSDSPSRSHMTNDHTCVPGMSATSESLKLNPVAGTTSDSQDLQSLKWTKSDSSIATNYSLNTDPPEGQMNSILESVDSHNKRQILKFKTPNSLTTVLDGHCKFSNCSLVHPVEVYQVTSLENNVPSKCLKSTASENSISIDQATPGVDREGASSTSIGLQYDQLSLTSVYQSAESLNLRELQTEDQQESSLFPDWLLNIYVSDVSESEVDSLNSVQSVWDSDSLEDRMDLNHDVQVDTMGGGDPQQGMWE